MKLNALNYIFLSLLISLFCPPAFSYDAVFNVTGRVQENTCRFSGSNKADVDLGNHTIDPKGFGSYVGSQTREVSWMFTLSCSEGTSVSYSISGSYYENDKTVLRIDNTSDKAEGVGIAVFVSTDNLIFQRQAIGWPYSVPKKNIVNGILEFHMRAHYQQVEKDISPGSANSNLTVEFTYQ